MFKAGWYLVYTKPRHERSVDKRLTEMEITSYLPIRKMLRQWHDRRKYVDELLFPSYVFVYLNNLQQYYESLDTEGVLYFIRVGKEIASVSETVINSIKVVTGQAADLEVSEQRFAPGSKVEIMEGALTGLSCEVVSHDSKKKLLVRVGLLKRNLLVSVPSDHLIAV